MSKRDVERMFADLRDMAERLTAGEEKLATSQLADQLRLSGIDPEALKKRLHEAVKGIAARERAAGRVPPFAVQQAIEQTAPDDVIPNSQKTAEEKMGRWLDRFGSGFSLPDQLGIARAYRKSGDVNEDDQADLDSLEEDLKDRIKKKHDGEA